MPWQSLDKVRSMVKQIDDENSTSNDEICLNDETDIDINLIDIKSDAIAENVIHRISVDEVVKTKIEFPVRE